MQSRPRYSDPLREHAPLRLPRLEALVGGKHVRRRAQHAITSGDAVFCLILESGARSRHLLRHRLLIATGAEAAQLRREPVDPHGFRGRALVLQLNTRLEPAADHAGAVRARDDPQRSWRHSTEVDRGGKARLTGNPVGTPSPGTRFRPVPLDPHPRSHLSISGTSVGVGGGGVVVVGVVQSRLATCPQSQTVCALWHCICGSAGPRVNSRTPLGTMFVL